MTRNELIAMLVAVALLVIGLIMFNLRGVNINTAQVIEIIILFALVLVTTIYAKRTAEIANATKNQAREIREQRYTESLPLLVPDVAQKQIVGGKLGVSEVDYLTLQTGVGMEITWHNLGKGVATNIRFSFWGAPLEGEPDKVVFFPPQAAQALGIAERKEIEISKTWVGQVCKIPKAYHSRLIAEYQDIYERSITTVQEFQIDQQNKKALLGELYFTINNIRLGNSQ